MASPASHTSQPYKIVTGYLNEEFIRINSGQFSGSNNIGGLYVFTTLKEYNGQNIYNVYVLETEYNSIVKNRSNNFRIIHDRISPLFEVYSINIKTFQINEIGNIKDQLLSDQHIPFAILTDENNSQFIINHVDTSNAAGGGGGCVWLAYPKNPMIYFVDRLVEDDQKEMITKKYAFIKTLLAESNNFVYIRYEMNTNKLKDRQFPPDKLKIIIEQYGFKNIAIKEKDSIKFDAELNIFYSTEDVFIPNESGV